MKKSILAASLMSIAFSASAGVLSCDDLKAKIEKKVAGKGVKEYNMVVVTKDTKMAGRVLGTCEKGSMKIIHEKKKSKTAEKSE
ncbi:DUF1161 domain-containing protein [Undibacterium fentianense]|uniref:DUF1161 domain-containing protein n=1 Tax=Undibacterium fentianense TaxID=2828728 RepID=A0A941IE36_9BURK|nr:DUF1161 domain-containing protein [Undibacterium fentianense]MBR7800658.1 DUF1161 domain-containing protein [Undibacterium fentianense]